MTPGSSSPSHDRWVVSLWIEDARRQCELIDMGFQLALQRPFDYPTNDVLPKDFCGYLRYKDTSMKAILNRKCLEGMLHKADDVGSAKAFERYASFLSQHKKSGKFAARKDNWKYYLWLMPCTSNKAVRFNCYHERVPCEKPVRVLPEPKEVPEFSTSPLREEERPDKELLSWMDEYSVSEINFDELHDNINKTCESSKNAVREVEKYDYKNYKPKARNPVLSLRTPSPIPPKGKGKVENPLSFLPPPSKVLASRDPSPQLRTSSPISLLDEEKLSSPRGGSERISEEKREEKGVFFQPTEKKSTSKGERRQKTPIVFRPTPENNSKYVSPELSPLRSFSRPRKVRSRSPVRRTRRDSFGRIVERDERVRSRSRSRPKEGSRSRSRGQKKKRKRSRSSHKSRSKAQSTTPRSRDRSRSKRTSHPSPTKASSSGSLRRRPLSSRKGRSRSKDRSHPDSTRGSGNRGRSRSRERTVPHSRGRSRSKREKSQPRSRGRSPTVKSIHRSNSRRSIHFHSRVRESRPRESRPRESRTRERSRSRARKRVRLERRNHSVRERRRRSYSEKKKKKKKKKRKRYYDELHPKIPIIRQSRLEPEAESDDDPAKFDSMLNEYLCAEKDSD